jgi:small-conductance mechanosensitive channel
MNPKLFAGMLLDLWDDVKAPTVLWQVGAILLACSLGWALAWLIRRQFAGKAAQGVAVQFRLDGFGRVLSPLLMLGAVVLTKHYLVHWQHVNLLRVVIALLSALVVIRFVFYLLRRIFSNGGQSGSTLRAFEKLFASLVWLIFVLYITGLWPDLLDLLDDTTLPLGRHKISLTTILQALATVAVTLIGALWAGAALEQRVMQIDDMHTSMRVVMARLGRAVLILVAVLLSLSMVGIDLTVLSVFGGALGVGLGLGLQKIASNYVSGFVILLDRSLAIGDVISVEKFYGKVTQINTRYTVLAGGDGVESVIPNEMLVSSPMQNFSLSDSSLRLSVQLTVAYDTDIEMVLRALEETARQVARVAATPAPLALLKKFGADGIDLDLGFWITDPENGRGNVISDVNLAIWKVLKSKNVSLPFPQREIRILDDRLKPQPPA